MLFNQKILLLYFAVYTASDIPRVAFALQNVAQELARRKGVLHMKAPTSINKTIIKLANSNQHICVQRNNTTKINFSSEAFHYNNLSC